MTGIAIEGLGLVGAFGTGLQAFRDALAAGSVEPRMMPIAPDNDDELYPALKADPQGLKEFVSLRELRRIDYFSRLAILGAGLAIREASMEEADRKRMGMVIGTGYGATATTFGFMDSMLEFGDACASPTKFSNSVHNAAGANASITLKLEGANLTVSQFDMSVPTALHAAMGWLESGAVDSIIFGGVDEYCRALGYCYQRYFGEHPGKMDPLAFDKQTAIPGEGAAFMMLRRLEDAKNPLAIVERVHLGYRADNRDLPQDGLVIVGADGHAESGRHYAEALQPNTRVACYSPAYGSLPAGPAFDMAAATIALETEPGPIHCLRFNCHGDYGLVTLCRA